MYELLVQQNREQAGIGTYANPGMWNRVVAEVSKLADLAVAWYLEAHVMSGYSFLMKVGHALPVSHKSKNPSETDILDII